MLNKLVAPKSSKPSKPELLMFEGEAANPERAFGDVTVAATGGAAGNHRYSGSRHFAAQNSLPPTHSDRSELLDWDMIAQLHVEGHKNPFEGEGSL